MSCGICEEKYHINCVKESLKCGHSLCNSCMNKIIFKIGNSCPFCREKMIGDRIYTVKVVSEGIEFEIKVPEKEFLKNNKDFLPANMKPNETDEEYQNQLRKLIGVLQKHEKEIQNVLYDSKEMLVKKSIDIDKYQERIKNQTSKIIFEQRDYTLEKYKLVGTEIFNLFCKELNEEGFCGAVKSDKKTTCCIKRKNELFCKYHK